MRQEPYGSIKLDKRDFPITVMVSGSNISRQNIEKKERFGSLYEYKMSKSWASKSGNILTYNVLEINSK